MRRDDIRRVLKQQPFVPFRVLFSDGTVHEIRHPDMAIVTPSTMCIGVPDPNQPDAAEHFELVNLLHITRLEPVGAGAMPASS